MDHDPSEHPPPPEEGDDDDNNDPVNPPGTCYGNGCQNDPGPDSTYGYFSTLPRPPVRRTKAVATMAATTLLAAPGIVIVPDGMGAHMVGNHGGGAPLIHW